MENMRASNDFPCMVKCIGKENGRKSELLEVGTAGDANPEFWDLIGQFALGDIPEEQRAGISPDPKDMEGSWQIILARSESIDEIMKALGFNSFKRKMMSLFTPITEFAILNGGAPPLSMKITSLLPMKHVKEGIVVFNGKHQTFTDSDTGMWQSICVWDKGRALQRRDGAQGVMFDVRMVYPRDPHNIEVGPVQLFKWTYIPHATGVPVTACRWMKKIG